MSISGPHLTNGAILIGHVLLRDTPVEGQADFNIKVMSCPFGPLQMMLEIILPACPLFDAFESYNYHSDLGRLLVSEK